MTKKNSIRERASRNSHLAKAIVSFGKGDNYEDAVIIHYNLMLTTLKAICEEEPTATLISTIEQLEQQLKTLKQ